MSALPIMDVNADVSLERHELVGTLNLDESTLRALEMQPDEADLDKEEQALESHEVIELQAFSERKDWIVDKIKVLERMPPIEVFAGLNSVRASAPVQSGLPSREELEQWLVEHDRLEKETEVFDSGELKKFKKFTKAVSKRNLSPEDTDLIELTLTTIFEFDKLLHLLRDRSEQLDLLGIRLTWEEHRTAAWTDRTCILDDMRAFLASRSRWSPAIYASSTVAEDVSSVRRGSTVSITSDPSILSSAGFSRAARYKLAESLSHDAAHFSSRIMTLRHSRVTGAGKALDKLIESSRKPVPDELLDEQDRLEEQGISEMEDVGKFVMNVVTLWRRADEFYVETLKDQSVAQQLHEEIETAKLSHPLQRQVAAFNTRAGALSERLRARSAASSLTSHFPQPCHDLFPQQSDFNLQIVKVLDAERTLATSLVERVVSTAQGYHSSLVAVDAMTSLSKDATALIERFESIRSRLRDGVEATDGDGSGLNLSTVECLNQMAHSAYLALLPSLLRDLDLANKSALELLPRASAALLAIGNVNVDSEFKQQVTLTLDGLSSIREQTTSFGTDVEKRVVWLREARHIWSSAESILRDLASVKSDVDDALDQVRWKQPPTLPSTPESSTSLLPAAIPIDQMLSLLDQLNRRFASDVNDKIRLLSPLISRPVHDYIAHRSTCLSEALDQVALVARSASSVEKQSTTLTTLHEEMYGLQERVERVRDDYSQLCDAVLTDTYSPDDWDLGESRLRDDTTNCEQLANTFIREIAHRVPLVARESHSTHSLRRRNNSLAELTLDSLPTFLPLEARINFSQVDDVVQSACNTLSIQLAGDVDALKRYSHRLRIARQARELDESLRSLLTLLRDSENALSSLQERIDSTSQATNPDLFYDGIATDGQRLQDTLSPQLLKALERSREIHADLLPLCDRDETTFHLEVKSTRSQELNSARLRYDSWTRAIQALCAHAAELSSRSTEIRLRPSVKAGDHTEPLDNGKDQMVDSNFAQTEQIEPGGEMHIGSDMHEPSLILRKAAERTKANENGMHDSSISQAQSRVPSAEMLSLSRTIHGLRERLHDLDIDVIAQPPAHSRSSLPSQGKGTIIATQFSELSCEVRALPLTAPHVAVDTELSALRADFTAMEQLLQRIIDLSNLHHSVQECDNALSDLLEHIDSFPDIPLGPLSSGHSSSPLLSPREQLLSRLTFTGSLMDETQTVFNMVVDDRRAVLEHDRIKQTWSELEAMAMDRINGLKSRPPSAISSGRSSRASIDAYRTIKKKANHYSNLSLGSPWSSGQYLSPSGPARLSSSTRRINTDKENTTHSRTSSRMSMASTRSTSGPQALQSPRLFSSTFASRQRTTSLSSTPGNTPVKYPATRTRLPSSQRHAGVVSPTPSDAPPRPSTSLSRPANSRPQSTFGRAPRIPFPNSSHPPPRTKSPTRKRKAYVANPKNKLDVAVGEVVNSLPMDIDIEVADDSWEDQSGKYWIGTEDPKLCFCRILRSQTVMVRVGGGWQELSKFIQMHFADSFRILPESTPYLGSREEKWISSTTILEGPASAEQSPRVLKTPEQKRIPSFSFSTPNGRSPQSMKSTSSPGSPLTPLQFMRRADLDGVGVRPSTPSKGPVPRSRLAIGVPTRPQAPVWKP